MPSGNRHAADLRDSTELPPPAAISRIAGKQRVKVSLASAPQQWTMLRTEFHRCLRLPATPTCIRRD
jgi:hypothetical protein